MKKRLIAFMGTLALMLASCNQQVFDFDYHFDKCHIFEEHKCIEITNWRDYDDSDQLQVKTKDGVTLLFHSSSIILINGRCPICEA